MTEFGAPCVMTGSITLLPVSSVASSILGNTKCIYSTMFENKISIFVIFRL